MKDERTACDILKPIVEKGKRSLNFADENYEDSKKILDLMEENLVLWNE